mgnify:CR=1 FL=1
MVPNSVAKELWAENAALRAELARLKAPVTEEERKEMLNWFDGIEQGLSMGAWRRVRAKIRDLITSPRRDGKFIAHIQSHLTEGQEVICKICGKTAKEIVEGE